MVVVTSQRSQLRLDLQPLRDNLRNVHGWLGFSKVPTYFPKPKKG